MVTNNKNYRMRIAKRIAASGFCSRRQAEKYIKLEKVSVNNQLITSLGIQVKKNDKIFVEGTLIKNIPNTKLYMFNKPKGCIVSEHDPQNRKTIYDLLNKNKERLLYIGRLDFNSEGLLLLTNNGKLKRYFELPKNKIQRTYKVKVYGDIKKINKKQLKEGITINRINYGSVIVNTLKNNLKNSWLEIKINEGKNREIRKILNYFGLKVNDLIRISFGPYNLEKLEKAQIKELKIKPTILKKINFD
tara:strand:- start:27723 stop:28460 length:738 start_codon:yes stop_codon:yes gene_type:complete